MSGLKEDRLILSSASAFNLLQYVIFIEVYEENPASPRYTTGKKSVLVAFPDNCSYCLT